MRMPADDFRKVEIISTRVRGNVYMLKGAGGYIGLSTDAFIETLYNDLTGNKSGEFIKRN